jgi:hypothetical protein
MINNSVSVTAPDKSLRAGIAQSVQPLARAGWSGDRVLAGARFPAQVQTGSGTHSASYTMATGSFPGGKVAGTWR